MSSSFKNAEKARRRSHKERGQVSSRSKFGLLEKRKDYQKRARDYHIKEKRLKVLQLKARDRNPDEFYYKMINSKTKEGHHYQKNMAKAPEKQARVRVLCRDLFQIESERMQLVKEIEEMQVSLSLMPGMPEHPKRRHTVFLETEEDADNFNTSANAQAEFFDTHPALLGHPSNRLRTDQLASEEIAVLGKKMRKKAQRNYETKAKQLEEARARVKALEQQYIQLTARKDSLSFKRRRRPKVLRSKRV